MSGTGAASRVSGWQYWLAERIAASGEPSVELTAQFRRNLWLYAIGTLTLGAQQLLMARRDYLVKDAVDAISRDRAQVAATAALWILMVSAGAFASRLLSRVTVFAGGRNVEYELRNLLLAHLHRLGPSFYGQQATGDIMSRATNDLQQVRLLLGFGILNVAGSAFALVSALWVMVDISVSLTAAALSSFPLLMLVTRRFSTQMFARTRENQEALGRMSDRVLASLAGVRVVRAFAMEESELAAFQKTNRRYLDASLSLAWLRGMFGPIFGAISSIGVLVVFWYGGSLLIEGRISTGDFVAFWLALLRLIWPLMAIGFVAGIVQRGRASYRRLKDIFDIEPDIQSGDRPAPETVRGALEVRSLGFAYGSRRVLDDVSFSVPAGRSLAIVGRTGSGKTTLAALLPRLMATPPGTVFLDGVDVTELPLEVVRASIGYAQQDAFLFSTTVAENVGYALDEPDAHRELIEAAAREAQVLDDILLLPEGFETVVGERGVQLSGGQKQRVALARALIREPPILVLDDPLSAVDAKTEAAILEAIDRQADKRTVILITHRVAAAKRCDRVVVLERGRIVESGTHDELVAREGLYALFAREQEMEADLEAISQRTLPTEENPALEEGRAAGSEP